MNNPDMHRAGFHAIVIPISPVCRVFTQLFGENMPVTIHINEKAPKQWEGFKVESDAQLLQGSCYDDHIHCKKIIQSSFGTSMLRENHISPSGNGFVYSLIEAYSSHHPVHIRPEDVWFAILSQLGFYINAHA